MSTPPGAPHDELWCFPDTERKPVDVVGLGECSLDTVHVVHAIPGPGGKEEILQTFEAPGGQVATTLLACSRLGLRCAYLGAVGSDAAGDRALGPLREASVDLSGVRVVGEAATRSAVILVARNDGERAVLGRRDPRLRLAPADLHREEILRGRLLYLDARDPELATWAAGVARERGIPVVLDADTPAPGVDRLLARVDFPVVSAEFTETYFGTRSPTEGIQGLLGLGARFAVVTLGDRGAVGGDGETELESPPFAVDVKDTTGAGDAFHAGFLWALLEGRSAAACLRVANAVAALNCRAYGAQGGLATRKELQSFLEGQEGPTQD